MGRCLFFSFVIIFPLESIMIIFSINDLHPIMCQYSLVSLCISSHQASSFFISFLINSVTAFRFTIIYVYFDQIAFQKSQKEWLVAFYIAAVIYVLGVIFFLIFSDGEIQEWAKDDEILEMVETDKPEADKLPGLEEDPEEDVLSDDVVFKNDVEEN